MLNLPANTNSLIYNNGVKNRCKNNKHISNLFKKSE